MITPPALWSARGGPWAQSQAPCQPRGFSHSDSLSSLPGAALLWGPGPAAPGTQPGGPGLVMPPPPITPPPSTIPQDQSGGGADPGSISSPGSFSAPGSEWSPQGVTLAGPPRSAQCSDGRWSRTCLWRQRGQQDQLGRWNLTEPGSNLNAATAVSPPVTRSRCPSLRRGR